MITGTALNGFVLSISPTYILTWFGARLTIMLSLCGNDCIRSGSKTACVGLHMQWDRILVTEFVWLGFVLISLGFIKAPRFLMRRKLAKGSPWGYYADQVPKKDPGYYDENDHDFMHDMGTQFGGLEGFGEYGEFSGFGELGEFGGSFFGGSDS